MRGNGGQRDIASNQGQLHYSNFYAGKVKKPQKAVTYYNKKKGARGWAALSATFLKRPIIPWVKNFLSSSPAHPPIVQPILGDHSATLSGTWPCRHQSRLSFPKGTQEAFIWGCAASPAQLSNVDMSDLYSLL